MLLALFYYRFSLPSYIDVHIFIPLFFFHRQNTHRAIYSHPSISFVQCGHPFESFAKFLIGLENRFYPIWLWDFNTAWPFYLSRSIYLHNHLYHSYNRHPFSQNLLMCYRFSCQWRTEKMYKIQVFFQCENWWSSKWIHEGDKL